MDAADQHGEGPPTVPPHRALDGPFLADLLRQTCERGGWTYAEVWVPAPERGTLELHPLWHGDATSGRHFRSPTSKTSTTTSGAGANGLLLMCLGREPCELVIVPPVCALSGEIGTPTVRSAHRQPSPTPSHALPP